MKIELLNYIRFKGVFKKDEWVEVGRKCGGLLIEIKFFNKVVRMSRKRN